MSVDRWDVTVAALGAAGVVLAIAEAPLSAFGTEVGAAIAAGAGALLLLRRLAEQVELWPPDRSTWTPPTEGPVARSFERDPFARRELFESLATSTIRSFGAGQWAYTPADMARICALPAPEFRRWAIAQLDALEEGT